MRVWILTALVAIAAWSSTAQAQNRYLRMAGSPPSGYIQVPPDPLLDTPQMTVEAWVSVRDSRGTGCSSIAGNGYTTGWWLGLCGTTMRSYFNGAGSSRDGGVIPNAPGEWIHIAATTDGPTRRHYINGVLVTEQIDGPATASVKPMRIGSDPDWDYMPVGTIDDLRIWKVARTQEQIRRTMYAVWRPGLETVTTEFDGLEAWYRFEGDAMDSWRTHHGTMMGTGLTFVQGTVFVLELKRRATRH